MVEMGSKRENDLKPLNAVYLINCAFQKRILVEKQWDQFVASQTFCFKFQVLSGMFFISTFPIIRYPSLRTRGAFGNKDCRLAIKWLDIVDSFSL